MSLSDNELTEGQRDCLEQLMTEDEGSIYLTAESDGQVEQPIIAPRKRKQDKPKYRPVSSPTITQSGITELMVEELSAPFKQCVVDLVRIENAVLEKPKAHGKQITRRKRPVSSDLVDIDPVNVEPSIVKRPKRAGSTRESPIELDLDTQDEPCSSNAPQGAVDQKPLYLTPSFGVKVIDGEVWPLSGPGRLPLRVTKKCRTRNPGLQLLEQKDHPILVERLVSCAVGREIVIECPERDIDRVLDLIPITGLQAPPPICRTVIDYRRSANPKPFGDLGFGPTGYPKYPSSWRKKVLAKRRYANKQSM